MGEHAAGSLRVRPARFPSLWKGNDSIHRVTQETWASDDLPFIFSSWIRSACAVRPKGTSKDAFCALLHRRIELTLQRSNVLVLCGVPDSEWIEGWLCSSFNRDTGEFTLHWALTKSPCRRNGCFKTLLRAALPDGVTRLTYRNKPISPVFEEKIKSWGFMSEDK